MVTMGEARGQEIKGQAAWKQLARMQSLEAFQQHTQDAFAAFTTQKQRLFPSMKVMPGAKRKREADHEPMGGNKLECKGHSQSLKEVLGSCDRACSHLKVCTRYVDHEGRPTTPKSEELRAGGRDWGRTRSKARVAFVPGRLYGCVDAGKERLLRGA
eukprot:scaffold1929_cov376-Prasinococcus_capsulatus_cf.AAC.9